MTAHVLWQPNEQGLREICDLLERQISPTDEKLRVWQQFQHYLQFADFNNYLAFIFAHGYSGKAVEIRQVAGLLLKNNLRIGFKSINPLYQRYIKAKLLPCIAVEDRHIRNTAGTIISVVVQEGGISGWPELLQGLLQCLDSNEFDAMEGAMDALFKICEDAPQELDLDVPGLAERPINVFLPRFLKLMHSPHASLRKLSLGSINEFIRCMPTALFVSMDQYIQGLLFLMHDPVAEVRELVCAAFVKIKVLDPSFLEPQHVRKIIEFMLQSNKDSDDGVALEASEFWKVYCDSELNQDLLREYLPQLIPVLLSNIVFAEDDESLVDAEADDSIPDRDQDLRPQIHSSRFHDLDYMNEDDDDNYTVWNIRKYSAAGLESLSNVYGAEILPLLMPLVQAKLSSSGDDKWKEREVAVFALGAIVEGCIEGLYPHLTEIVEFLIPLCDDKFPLLRSIACWTLSRFSKFVVKDVSHQKDDELFTKVLMGILRGISDSNKRVQGAACAALAAIEEEAAEKLLPHLEVIIRHLVCALARYQRKNLRIIYDAIGTLADAVGEELNQPRYLQILMPPLLAKWQQLSNFDRYLYPLIESITSIALAIGNGISPFAEPLFQRCINIIQSQLMAKADPAAERGQFDEDIVVSSLDLLVGLTECLGDGIKSLILSSDLRDELLRCCIDTDANVKNSAFAFLGDLALACPTYLQPRLCDFMNAAVKELSTFDLMESHSVAITACWAIGQLAMKVGREISPFVLSIIFRLRAILQLAEPELNGPLMENSAITLGRVALVCPEVVSQHIEHFIQSWCTALSMMKDDVRKEDAFRGLCAVVRANPTGALGSLLHMCNAFASWQMMTESLLIEARQVLLGYKQMLGDAAWEQQCLSALQSPVKKKLAEYEM